MRIVGFFTEFNWHFTGLLLEYRFASAQGRRLYGIVEWWMKCEFCHLNEACVEVQQITDGALREVHMCAECAAAKGLNSPVDLAGMLLGGDLFPQGADAPGEAKAENAVGCPVCHMRASDFRKTSRLGCAQCYETFADIIKPMLESMHRATVYAGKQPVREDVRSEISGLKAALARAIKAEAYEEAAALRDRINILELADACMDEDMPEGIPV